MVDLEHREEVVVLLAQLEEVDLLQRLEKVDRMQHEPGKTIVFTLLLPH